MEKKGRKNGIFQAYQQPKFFDVARRAVGGTSVFFTSRKHRFFENFPERRKTPLESTCNNFARAHRGLASAILYLQPRPGIIGTKPTFVACYVD